MAKNRSFGVSLGQRVKAATAAKGDTYRKTKKQCPSSMNLSSKRKEAQNLKPAASQNIPPTPNTRQDRGRAIACMM